jgi:uncharacterized protein (TIRG00374 family)
MTEAHKKHLRLGLKILLTVALLALIFNYFSFTEMLEVLKRTSLVLFGSATLVFFAVMWLQSLRWRILMLIPNSQKPGLHTFFAYTAIGYFANMFLPSSIGGDVVKTLALGRSMGKTAESVSATLIARLQGVSSLLLFFWAVAIVRKGDFGNAAIIIPIMILCTILIGGINLLMLLKQKPEILTRYNKLNSLFRALYLYSAEPGVYYRAFGLSLINQFLMVLMSWLIYISVGVPLSLADMLLYVPVFFILTLIPLTIFNIGVKEGLSIWLFTTIPGVLAVDCLAANFLGYVLAILSAMVGGAYLWFMPSVKSKLQKEPKTP